MAVPKKRRTAQRLTIGFRRRYGGRLRRRVGDHIRRTLVRGLLLLLPVAITFLVFRFFYELVNGILHPVLEYAKNRWQIDLLGVPGLGFVVALLLVYVAGFFLAIPLGRGMVRWGQQALLRTPVVGQLYSATRKLVESFSGTAETGFKRVVMLQYPRAGAWTIGFLTAITTTSDGQRLAVVFIPNAPLPNSGWVAILPTEDVLDTDLSVPAAMQIIFSGGIVTPETIKTTKLQTAAVAGAKAPEQPSVPV